MKCKHPSVWRRTIVNLSIFGEGFAKALYRFSMLIQKIANTLSFEHFWKQEVAPNQNVLIVPSFSKSGSKHKIWDIAIERVRCLGEGGKVLEFGTNNGGSLYYFWKNLPGSTEFHGFDCFEGIPEAWDKLPKGAIKGFGYPAELWNDFPDQKVNVEEFVTRTGEIPPVPQENIKIHKGLFCHTIPSFCVAEKLKDVQLLHFDADIYMSTRPVLDAICGQMRHHYYILFDELYSVNHEFKAWMEFIDLFHITRWRVVAISEDGVQALFEINY
ncbi:MAG: hypothetical protein CMO10_15100 [Thalassospira sp.]|nr:hypothetical protein [Thalassospira sp.]